VSGPPSWKRAAGLGALGVALHVAAFPPFSLWPLALLAPWPLALLALHARSAGRAFLRLYLAGVAIFVLGSWWLAATSPVNLAIVALVDAGWFGAFGWAAHRALSRRAAWPALPVLWTAHELLRIHAPLSGYPWQLLGQALAANRVAVQAADIGGVLLVTFLAACVSAAGLGWQRHERRWAWALLLPALGVVYGLVRPDTLAEPRPGPVLAAIQPAFPQHLKEDVEAADVRYERCLDLSDQALLGGEKVDLLVWPETMWPFAMGEGEPGQEFTRGFGVDYVKQAESRFLAPLLAGGPLGDRAARLLIGTPYFRIGPDGRVLTSNSAVYFDRDGRRLGRYDKVILVPGGEAIPYARWLPAGLRRWAEGLIRSIAGFVVDLEPGPGVQLVELDGVRLGVTICFENAYGDFNRECVRQGADVLVNLSNEAWFGETELDDMELHSVLRAVETRRAVFRSTNSGISCLVRPDGRAPQGADRLVVDGRDRTVAGAFRARVPIHTDRTLYLWWGDRWAWACVIWALVLAWRPARTALP
jgi:apolipoprotein N-acyltransferase